MLRNQYQVGKKLSNGSFGELRLGRDLRHRAGFGTGDGLVAIKLEPASAKMPMLKHEFRVYRALGPNKGLPRVRGRGFA